MQEISAKIIADSINPKGVRITSLVATFPRYILAELNTHRAFTRNSASSRAVPFEKMLKRIQEDPFIPIKWMKDHSGMQGNEFETSKRVIDVYTEKWIEAKDKAVKSAKQLSALGLTKQIVNRLLEPFMWHTAIVTATDWENFFALRAHNAADIHFQDLAYKILDGMNESKPKNLKAGEWHIPFGDNISDSRIFQDFKLGTEEEWGIKSFRNEIEDLKIKIATARCARVSYINFEGKDDYSDDLKLYERLLSMGHMSPFEHCAMSVNNTDYVGNFKGFVQLRKTLDNENKTDKRLL